jgi:quinohemoprotein ethanol dehydrogenase
MILAKRAALAVGILTLAGATRLPAQKTTKPVNIDGKVLRNTGNVADYPRPGSWLSYGRNQSETCYSSLKQINDSNAKRLGLEWTYAVGAGGGNQEGTPRMWNNTLYGITTWSVVYALDVRTGKELWRWDPEVNQAAVRPKICCGIGGGTVTTAGNLIFQSIIFKLIIFKLINDGRFRAVTADKGEILYEIKSRTGMAPPITYEGDGKQYVAFQGGLGRPATTVGPNDEKIENPPMMFVFELDGKAEMPKAALLRRQTTCPNRLRLRKNLRG